MQINGRCDERAMKEGGRKSGEHDVIELHFVLVFASFYLACNYLVLK